MLPKAVGGCGGDGRGCAEDSGGCALYAGGSELCVMCAMCPGLHAVLHAVLYAALVTVRCASCCLTQRVTAATRLTITA